MESRIGLRILCVANLRCLRKLTHFIFESLQIITTHVRINFSRNLLKSTNFHYVLPLISVKIQLFFLTRNLLKCEDFQLLLVQYYYISCSFDPDLLIFINKQLMIVGRAHISSNQLVVFFKLTSMDLKVKTYLYPSTEKKTIFDIDAYGYINITDSTFVQINSCVFFLININLGGNVLSHYFMLLRGLEDLFYANFKNKCANCKVNASGHELEILPSIHVNIQRQRKWSSSIQFSHSICMSNVMDTYSFFNEKLVFIKEIKHFSIHLYEYYNKISFIYENFYIQRKHIRQQ